MPTPKGYSSQEKEDRLRAEFQTLNPIGPKTYGADVRSTLAYTNIASDAIDSIANGYIITAAAHTALVGDIVKFTSGLADDLWSVVVAVDTNTIELGIAFTGSLASRAPAAADTFDIYRPDFLTTNAAGQLGTSNGAATTQDVGETIENDYSSTNVTTGAFVELVAALGVTAVGLEIFDSSGETLELATGAAASEVRKMLIMPGGNSGVIPVSIASGTRLSVRAVSANATVGRLNINVIS